MKKTDYVRAEMKIHEIDTFDVITTSGNYNQNSNTTGGYDMPFIPKQH